MSSDLKPDFPPFFSRIAGLIVENVPVGLALVSSDGFILWANRAACKFWERDFDTLLSLRWQDFTVPEDIEADSNRVQEVLDGEIDHYDMVKGYVMPNGEVKSAILSVFATHDDEYPFVSMIQPASDASIRFRMMSRRDQFGKDLDRSMKSLKESLKRFRESGKVE